MSASTNNDIRRNLLRYYSTDTIIALALILYDNAPAGSPAYSAMFKKLQLCHVYGGSVQMKWRIFQNILQMLTTEVPLEFPPTE